MTNFSLPPELRPNTTAKGHDRTLTKHSCPECGAELAMKRANGIDSRLPGVSGWHSEPAPHLAPCGLPCRRGGQWRTTLRGKFSVHTSDNCDRCFPRVWRVRFTLASGRQGTSELLGEKRARAFAERIERDGGTARVEREP